MDRYDGGWNRGYGGPQRGPYYDGEFGYAGGGWGRSGGGPSWHAERPRGGYAGDFPGAYERGPGPMRGRWRGDPGAAGYGGGRGVPFSPGYAGDYGPPRYSRGGGEYEIGARGDYGDPTQQWTRTWGARYDAMLDRAFEQPPYDRFRPERFSGPDYGADFGPGYDEELDGGFYDAGGFGDGWDAEPDDTEVQRRVWQSLHQDGFVDAESIDVEVKDRVVTLRGEVADHMEARYAWDDAWDAEGVRGVVSKLTVRGENRQEAPPKAAKKAGSSVKASSGKRGRAKKS